MLQKGSWWSIFLCNITFFICVYGVVLLWWLVQMKTEICFLFWLLAAGLEQGESKIICNQCRWTYFRTKMDCHGLYWLSQRVHQLRLVSPFVFLKSFFYRKILIVSLLVFLLVRWIVTFSSFPSFLATQPTLQLLLKSLWYKGSFCVGKMGFPCNILYAHIML